MLLLLLLALPLVSVASGASMKLSIYAQSNLLSGLSGLAVCPDGTVVATTVVPQSNVLSIAPGSPPRAVHRLAHGYHFAHPSSVATDANCTAWIANSEAQNLLSLDVGTNASAEPRLRLQLTSDVSSLAWDAAGNTLFALFEGRGDLLAITWADSDRAREGPPSLKWHNSTLVEEPRELAFDAVGRVLYITDGGAGTVLRYTTAAGIEAFSGTSPQLKQPFGIAVVPADAAGRDTSFLLVVNQGDDSVARVELSSGAVSLWYAEPAALPGGGNPGSLGALPLLLGARDVEWHGATGCALVSAISCSCVLAICAAGAPAPGGGVRITTLLAAGGVLTLVVAISLSVRRWRTKQARGRRQPLLDPTDASRAADTASSAVAAKGEVLRSETHRFNTAKLMFIGQKRAGKTSLLRNLSQQGFDAAQPTTDGADLCVMATGDWQAKKPEDAAGALASGVSSAIARAHAAAAGRRVPPPPPARCHRKFLLVLLPLLALSAVAAGVTFAVVAAPAATSQPTPAPPSPGPWTCIGSGCCKTCPQSHPYCVIECGDAGITCMGGMARCATCVCTCRGEPCCYNYGSTVSCPAQPTPPPAPPVPPAPAAPTPAPTPGPVTKCTGASVHLEQGQCEAWITFFNSTGGGAWHHCNDTQTDPCACKGADGKRPTCNAGGTAVIRIYLPGSGLAGTLPPCIYAFVNVTDFNVPTNPSLTGSIPAGVGNWVHLTRFNTGNCGFTGHIPADVGNWSQLENFEVGDNGFSGTIPAGTENWTKLGNFDVRKNGLSGTIPAGAGNWAQLRSFEVGNNHFTGSIPGCVGNWAQLTNFNTGTNDFSGTIPADVGKWPLLKAFTVGSNGFTGSIPASVGNWTQLATFAVFGNSFSGSIPGSVGNWLLLKEFAASSNSFSGTLPKSIGNWQLMAIFKVASNGFSGTLPDCIGNWTRLTSFSVPGNDFTGMLPGLPFTQVANTDSSDCFLLDRTGSYDSSGSNSFDCPWPAGVTSYCKKSTASGSSNITDADCTSPPPASSTAFYAGAIIGGFAVFAAATMSLRHHRRRKQAVKNTRIARLPQLQSIAEAVQKMPDDLVLRSAHGDVGAAESITLHTWDFAGQSIYYVTHHLFVTRGIYVLVFDLTEARDDLQKCIDTLAFWLNSLETQIEDPEDFGAILVGTHCDVVSEHTEHAAISRELNAALEPCAAWQRVAQPPPPPQDGQTTTAQQLLCFHPVDNTQALGGAVLRAEIQRIAEDIVNRKPEYPVQWLSLVDLMQAQASSGVNYMPVHEEQRGSGSSSGSSPLAAAPGTLSIEVLLDHAGIETHHALEFCEFCDEMGIFRLFKRSGTERPLLILRPQWLVDVFSSVITQRQLAEQRCAGACDAASWQRFVDKAVVSRELLKVLWSDMPDDVDLLVEVMTAFDLLVELRGEQDSATTRARQSFLVPGMLPEEPEVPEVAVSARCFFAFCDKGDSASAFARHAEPSDAMPAVLRAAWLPLPGRVRKLPSGLFTRLMARAASWNQFTSDVEPDLSRQRAILTFGMQRFELRVDFARRAICFGALSGCHTPLGVVMSLKGMLDEILEQVHPLLRCDAAVSAVGAARNIDLVDLLQLQEATKMATPGQATFRMDNVQRPLPPLLPWLALHDDLASPSSGFDIFLSFRDVDAPFAGKLADCIARQTVGRSRIRVFPVFKTNREERVKGLVRSRIFVPIISSRLLQQWHNEAPPVYWMTRLLLAMVLFTVLHIGFDVAFMLAQPRGSWRFAVMLLSLVLPTVAQAFAVSRTIATQIASNHSFSMWYTRHGGATGVLSILGCVRPDLMAALLRCRAFGWDLFDAPLPVGARSDLRAFTLITTLLHDAPQLVAQWDGGGGKCACFAPQVCDIVARVTLGCSIVSLCFTLASRANAVCFLFASTRVRDRRPAQAWGHKEVDEVLLECMVALDLCSNRRSRGGDMSYDRYRKEGLRKLHAAMRHNLTTVLPLVIDEVGTKGAGGRVITDLHFSLHRQVPAATAAEGARVLEELGVTTDGQAGSSSSAVHHTLNDTVLRVLAQPDLVDVGDELGSGSGGVWAVFERVSGFLAHKVSQLQAAS
jgi:GTPase SAR1 family protein